MFVKLHEFRKAVALVELIHFSLIFSLRSETLQPVTKIELLYPAEVISCYVHKDF